MKMLKKIITALLWLFPAALSAQPSDYYRPPLDIPVSLSANYGEMRTNRFHTGIDIRTQGTIGHTMYAAADGYISRLTVSPTGYGRAVYINHPNGTMTVYAHMHRFTDEMEEFLKAERYRQKRSDIDVFPDAARFPVAKGDVIGVSGNSGSSFGPHVHFEVRRAGGTRTLNVVSHGWITAPDDIPPRIVRLYQVNVDTIAGVPVHSPKIAWDVRKKEDGNYALVRTSPLKVGPACYFVVEATDRKNDVYNTFGIYRAAMSVDGEESLIFEKDELLFADNRYCCASVLYDVQHKSRNEAVMLVVKDGNTLPMYKKSVGRGAVSTLGKDRRDIRITVEDDARNAVTLDFTVERDTTYTAPERPAGRIAPNRRDFIHSEGGLTLVIPKGALYEPMFYTHSTVEQPVEARPDSIRPLSPIYRIADGLSPLHKSMKLAVEAEIPATLRHRACLAKVSDDGRMSYAGGKWDDGAVKGSARDFGTFCAVADTLPPTIKSSFADGSDLSKTRTVTFTATDNFSGIASYSGTIDGEWVIFERQANKGQYIHTFDREKLAAGSEHTFVFTVRDGAGNTSEWRGVFEL